MKSDVTLIVPTYNRPAELTRLLTFLKLVKCSFPVLVLDGSEQDTKMVNRHRTEHQSEVVYQAYPSELHLGLRLADGLSRVETRYCLICPDDDIVFPEGVAQCAAFLDDHAEFSAAIGEVRAFVYSRKRRFPRGAMRFPNVLAGRYRLDQPTFRQRLMLLWAHTLGGCPPLFYALRRTDVARKAFALVTDEMTYSAQEMLINCVTLAMGNAISLPVAFGLRDYASETTRDAIRDDPTAYISTAQLELIARVVVPLLSERVTEIRTADAYGDVLGALNSWFAPGALPVNTDDRVGQDHLGRFHRAFDALVSIWLKPLMADHLRISRHCYSALVHAQVEYRRAVAGGTQNV